MKVKYKNYSANLNDDLMINQKIDTPEKIKELRDSYKNLWKLFCQIEKGDVNGAAEFIQEAEFRMQRAWGFKEDYTMHRYWFETPTCTCPKMENKDRIGTEYRVYVTTCPIHGTAARHQDLRIKKLKRLKNA